MVKTTLPCLMLTPRPSHINPGMTWLILLFLTSPFLSIPRYTLWMPSEGIYQQFLQFSLFISCNFWGRYSYGWKIWHWLETRQRCWRNIPVGKSMCGRRCGVQHLWDKDGIIEMLSAAQEGSWLSAGVDFDTILIRLGLLAYIWLWFALLSWKLSGAVRFEYDIFPA